MVQISKFTILFLMIFAVTGWSQPYQCGDVDCSGGTPESSDLTRFIDFLYLSHDPLCDSSVADVDGVPGITMNDFWFISYSIYITHQPLNCTPPADTLPPISDDTLEFQNTLVPANTSNWYVDIYEKAVTDIQSVNIPITFGCPGSDIYLESVDLSESRYSGINSIIDNDNNNLVLFSGSMMGVTPASEGLVARLYFSLTSVPYSQVLHIDTGFIAPAHHLIYAGISSQLFSFVPHVKGIELPVDFSATKTIGKAPMLVRFDPIVSCQATEYYWDFGDGGDSYDITPVYTYTGEGIYDVKLRISYDLGDSTYVDSIIKEDYIRVTELESDFYADPVIGTEPLMVSFTSDCDGSPTSYYWTFGDGENSPDANPTHVYDTAGKYTVSLSISDGTYNDIEIKPNFVRVDTFYTDLMTDIYDNGAQTGLPMTYYCGYSVNGTNPAASCTLKVMTPPEIVLDKTGYYRKDGDTLKFPLETIEPSKWPGGTIEITGTVPLTVPNGTMLRCQSWITTTTSDANMENNYKDHYTKVGAIDPLFYKTSSPEGSGTQHMITHSDRITFTLRFENNPGATVNAQNIWVFDTLDQNWDYGDIAIGPSSHPECDLTYEIVVDERTNDTICIMKGECIGIDLPPNISPPDGEGYFTFSISPRDDTYPSTELHNRAWILVDAIQPIPAPYEDPILYTVGATCCSYKYSGGLTGDANCSGLEEADISDIVRIIDNLYLSKAPLCCPEEADVNVSGTTNEPDISDIVYLIRHLYQDKPPLYECP